MTDSPNFDDPIGTDGTSGDLPGDRRARASERRAEQAKSFLSALFMAVRTGRIHSRSNRAFENAVRTLYDASQALFAATGGFRIVFVGDTTLLNDQRLRIDSTTFAVTRTLRALLEAKKLGGIGVQTAPTYESSEALIELLAAEGEADRNRVQQAQIQPIGPQTFVDDRREVRIDPRERAVRVYAKLLIALRDHFERYEYPGASSSDPRRVRIVRVVQDLVDVTSNVPAITLLLAHHRAGEWPSERHGANTCVLSLAMGLALGLDRGAIMDLGVAAALHHVGISSPFAAQPGVLDVEAIHRGVARILAESTISPSAARRALILSAHRRPATTGGSEAPPLLARIVGLCATYDQLCSGYGLKRPVRGAPVDVLALLARDQTGRFDPELVDLLINVLRVFPVGVQVVLQSGGRGVVWSHGGARRWDRPVVAQLEPERVDVDLMARPARRFTDGIVGTLRFLGAPPLRGAETLSAPGPARRGAEPVTTDLEALEQRDRLQQMPADTEALLRDFLQED